MPRKPTKIVDRITRRREKIRESAIDRPWFVARFADAGKSQRRVALEMGMDPSAMSNTLSGARRMRIDEAATLARVIGVPFEAIVLRAGIRPPAEPDDLVPVQAAVDARGTLSPAPTDGSLPRRMPRPGGLPDGAACAIVRSPGAVLDRCVVYYAPQAGRVPAEAVGRLCVVQLRDGTRLLGAPTQAFTAGTWTLRGLDGAVLAEGVPLLSATPVLWVRI